MNRQYRELISRFGHLVSKGKTGILCNQVSFDFTEGKYLFQLLGSFTDHLSVYIPEHGLFAEQQDQEVIQQTSQYSFLESAVHYESVYGSRTDRLGNLPQRIPELNTLIIDIQDVGVRYYTYVTTVGSILQIISEHDLDIVVIVVDRQNLAGRQVEGTILDPVYSSFIGVSGLPHRYGLTIGELCRYLKFEFGGKFRLEVITHDHEPFSINPSPNFPSVRTSSTFSGQCLIEGTNMSEGRGTTRPFEIFGAPFLKELSPGWGHDFNRLHPEAVLRPLLFVPAFHKYSNEICYGFQLHPVRDDFHSLWYSLQMLQSLKKQVKELQWREGPYEAWSDRPAMELLAGDGDMIGFLNGTVDEPSIISKMRFHENKWIDRTRPYLLYPDSLFSASDLIIIPAGAVDGHVDHES